MQTDIPEVARIIRNEIRLQDEMSLQCRVLCLAVLASIVMSNTVKVAARLLESCPVAAQ